MSTCFLRIIILTLGFAFSGCSHKTEQAPLKPEYSLTVKEVTVTEETLPSAISQEEVNSPIPLEVTEPTPRHIQTALKNAKIYKGNIDGIIGPQTVKAIETFQMENGLKADGKVGPKTWEKLKRYLY